jgi:hypothetical protein
LAAFFSLGLQPDRAASPAGKKSEKGDERKRERERERRDGMRGRAGERLADFE